MSKASVGRNKGWDKCCSYSDKYFHTLSYFRLIFYAFPFFFFKLIFFYPYQSSHCIYLYFLIYALIITHLHIRFYPSMVFLFLVQFPDYFYVHPSLLYWSFLFFAHSYSLDSFSNFTEFSTLCLIPSPFPLPSYFAILMTSVFVFNSSTLSSFISFCYPNYSLLQLFIHTLFFLNTRD